MPLYNYLRSQSAFEVKGLVSRRRNSAYLNCAISILLLTGCGGSKPAQDDPSLFTGNANWDLPDLQIAESYDVDPAYLADNNIRNAQRVSLARKDDLDIICTQDIEVFGVDIGLESGFNQNYGSSPDISVNSLKNIEAQNGPAQEYLLSYDRPNGVAVNALGRYFYFPPVQMATKAPTAISATCSSEVDRFTENESKILSLLDGIEFELSGTSLSSELDAFDEYSSYPGTDNGIRALFTDLQENLTNGDTVTALALAKGLFTFVREDIEHILDMSHPSSESVVGFIFDISALTSDTRFIETFTTVPERSQINVHSATTEQIAIADNGSTVFNEFPSGFLSLARSGLFQANKRFYEIEMVEPNKGQGTKWHFFSYTPNGWKMFGPLWRAVD